MVFPGLYSGSGGGGASGDNITVNGTAATDADFDDAAPAAPSGNVNVVWQIDTTTTPDSISAYVPVNDYEFISAIAISNQATAEFDLDNATYSNYMFMLENVVPVTDATTLWLRTSTDAGVSFDEGASDYAWNESQIGGTSGASSTPAGDQADTKIEMVRSAGSDTNENFSGHVLCLNPAGVAFTRFTFEFSAELSDGFNYAVEGNGARLSAADVDTIQFLFSSGNLESGTIRMYGLRGA